MKPWADIFDYPEYLAGRVAVIPDGDFTFYARRATAEIRRYTGNAIPDGDPVPEEAKLCCCEVAELLYRAEQADTGIVSESNGSLSQTYESADARKSRMQADIKSAVYAYLADGGYLYRGV